MGREGFFAKKQKRCSGGGLRESGLADSGRMHLYYHVGEDGKRCYTLKKKDPEGKPTVMPRPSPVAVCN